MTAAVVPSHACSDLCLSLLPERAGYHEHSSHQDCGVLNGQTHPQDNAAERGIDA